MEEKTWTIKESDVYAGVSDGMGCSLYFLIPLFGLYLLSQIVSCHNELSDSKKEEQLERILQGKEMVLKDVNKDGLIDLVSNTKDKKGIYFQTKEGKFVELPRKDYKGFVNYYLSNNKK
jgi:hypothetical protein